MCAKLSSLGFYNIDVCAHARARTAVGLFAQPEPCMDSALRMSDGTVLRGLFRGGGALLLGVQCLAALTITVWSCTCCILVLSSMQLLATVTPFR